MQINRCVCTGRTFADLLEQAERQGLSFEQLAERTGATHGCGLCRPYMRCAMRTGETVFHHILVDEPDTAAG